MMPRGPSASRSKFQVVKRPTIAELRVRRMHRDCATPAPFVGNNPTPPNARGPSCYGESRNSWGFQDLRGKGRNGT